MNKLVLFAMVAWSTVLFQQTVVSETFGKEEARDFGAEKEVSANAVTDEGWGLDYLNDDYDFDEDEEEEEEENFPESFVQEDPKPFWGRKGRVGLHKVRRN